MKKLLAIVGIASLCVSMAACSNGCYTESKVQAIHNSSVVTNTVPMSSFNDENYIWENWIIGTNKVQSID